LAAVRYGRPISLKEFEAQSGDDVMTDLARALMKRIGAAIPLVPGPAACWLLRENGSMPEEDVRSRILALMETDGLAFAEAQDAITSAVDQMVERRILTLEDGVLNLSGQREDLLDYYAESVPEQVKHANAALAKDVSAPAGS
jgi:glycerol-3-phosphate O-acyltransferase